MGASASILMATTSLASAYNQSTAGLALGRAQADQMRINASFSDLKAKETREQGTIAANRSRSRARQILGQQRAAQAATGQLGSGSSESVISETSYLGEIDAITIENNAWRQAWGFTQEANEQRTGARITEIGAKGAARNSLIVGGLQALSYGAEASYRAKGNKNTKNSLFGGDAWGQPGVGFSGDTNAGKSDVFGLGYNNYFNNRRF